MEIDGFRGRLNSADNADYDSARGVWNGAIDRRPRLIVRCVYRRKEEAGTGSITISNPNSPRNLSVSGFRTQLVQQGGTLLAQFSKTNDVDGVRKLIESGISPAALYRDGDGYYGMLDGVEIPTGYDEVDALLRERVAQQGGSKQ